MLQQGHRKGGIVVSALIGLLGSVGQTWAQPFVYVANEDSDTVSAYRIAADTGKLTPVPGSPFPAGDRPTSITVSPHLAPAPATPAPSR